MGESQSVQGVCSNFLIHSGSAEEKEKGVVFVLPGSCLRKKDGIDFFKEFFRLHYVNVTRTAAAVTREASFHVFSQGTKKNFQNASLTLIKTSVPFACKNVKFL